MNTYWYFTFQVKVKETGYEKEDWSIAASEDATFPLSLVKQWANEVFGDDVEIMVTNAIQISETEYRDHLKQIGVA